MLKLVQAKKKTLLMMMIIIMITIILIIAVIIINSPFQPGDFSAGSIVDKFIIEEKELVKTLDDHV